MSPSLVIRKTAAQRIALCASIAFSLAACSAATDRLTDYPDVNTASLPSQQEQAETVQQDQLNAPRQVEQQNWQNAPLNQRQVQNQQPAVGGAEVIVAPGQTLYSIARANSMSAQQLAQANNIPPPYTIHVGQRLRVPGSLSARSPEPRVQAANQPVEHQNFSQGGMHVVRSGETLFAVGRTYNMNPYQIADANGLSHDVALRVGQRLRIPGRQAVASNSQAPVQQPFKVQASQQQAQTEAETVTEEDAPTAPAMQSQQQVAQIQPPTQQTPDTTAGAFRWPVRGRVISTFGEKPSGMRNEGINISVPEGTSVKAAESGVIAYAGNELKGYGNLVLIRHENGWVTAYAHNRELFVKRGDTVKRGDIIAKAGQTGSVTSPQLHFEVRKGAAAVDPIKYLGSEQAAN